MWLLLSVAVIGPWAAADAGARSDGPAARLQRGQPCRIRRRLTWDAAHEVQVVIEPVPGHFMMI